MPYSWDDIRESAKHRAVLAIYRNAGPVTKPYYQHAHHLDGKNEENWAIQWCLWHSFRMFRNGSGAKMPKIELRAREFDAINGTPSSGSSSGASDEPLVQPETPTHWTGFDPSVMDERYLGPGMPDSPSWRSTGELLSISIETWSTLTYVQGRQMRVSRLHHLGREMFIMTLLETCKVRIEERAPEDVLGIWQRAFSC